MEEAKAAPPTSRSRPTRDDVARRAGVSSAVVSYVLNNGPRPVAKTTLDRVLEAVRELNYRPNDIARSLRGQRTHTVGLITPTLTNPVYAEVAMGITDVLGDESYLLMVCDAEDSPDHDTQYAHMLVSKQVDAVVLIPTADAADTLAILADGCVPVVVIEQNADPTPSVVFDAERTGQLATEHLIELGRTRIAIIRERRSGRDSWRRFAGYKKALQAAGIDVDDEFVVGGHQGIAAGVDAAERLLDLNDPPTDRGSQRSDGHWGDPHRSPTGPDRPRRPECGWCRRISKLLATSIRR